MPIKTWCHSFPCRKFSAAPLWFSLVLLGGKVPSGLVASVQRCSGKGEKGREERWMHVVQLWTWAGGRRGALATKVPRQTELPPRSRCTLHPVARQRMRHELNCTAIVYLCVLRRRKATRSATGRVCGCAFVPCQLPLHCVHRSALSSTEA